MKNYAALFMFFTLAISAPLLRADQLTVLGSADTFAVLATSAITNTGASSIIGNIGLSPNTSITGFPPGNVSGGIIDDDNAAAIAAEADASTAYNVLAALGSAQDISGQNLGTLTLTPGLYAYTADAQLDGQLTFDFQNQSNVDIIIQVGTALTTATGSTVVVVHQGTDDNVYYQVGSSATLGTDSTFLGDILAHSSVSLDTGAVISCGSAIALDGAVTLAGNSVSNCSTTGSDITPSGLQNTPLTANAPEPGTFALLATGLLGTAGTYRRRLTS